MKVKKPMPLGEAVLCAAGVAFLVFIGSALIVSIIVTTFLDDTSLQDKIGIPIAATVTAGTFFYLLYLFRRK